MKHGSHAIIAKGTRVVLAVLLTLLALAKAYSPPLAHQIVPPAWRHAAAIMDLLMAALVTTRYFRLGAYVLILVNAGGAALSMVFPGRSCGCTGSWLTLVGSEHILFASAFGFLAALLLWSDRPQSNVGHSKLTPV